jgi:hypothetical protein
VYFVVFWPRIRISERVFVDTHDEWHSMMLLMRIVFECDPFDPGPIVFGTTSEDRNEQQMDGGREATTLHLEIERRLDWEDE